MGNHYHLVVAFNACQKLEQADLYRRGAASIYEDAVGNMEQVAVAAF